MVAFSLRTTCAGLNSFALGCRPLRQVQDRSKSGSLAMFAAMRRASSRVSRVAADPPRLVLEIDVGERVTVCVAHDLAVLA
jgi:hypothetical protein